MQRMVAIVAVTQDGRKLELKANSLQGATTAQTGSIVGRTVEQHVHRGLDLEAGTTGRKTEATSVTYMSARERVVENSEIEPKASTMSDRTSAVSEKIR